MAPKRSQKHKARTPPQYDHERASPRGTKRKTSTRDEFEYEDGLSPQIQGAQDRGQSPSNESVSSTTANAGWCPTPPHYSSTNPRRSSSSGGEWLSPLAQATLDRGRRSPSHERVSSTTATAGIRDDDDDCRWPDDHPHHSSSSILPSSSHIQGASRWSSGGGLPAPPNKQAALDSGRHSPSCESVSSSGATAGIGDHENELRRRMPRITNGSASILLSLPQVPGAQNSGYGGYVLNPPYAYAADSSSSQQHPTVQEADPLFARYPSDAETTHFDPYTYDAPRPSKPARHGDRSPKSKSSSSKLKAIKCGVVPADAESLRTHPRRKASDHRCKCERCKPRKQSTRAFTPIAQAKKIPMVYSELQIKDGVPVWTDTVVWGPLRK
ncbi:hypothetical protein EVG20_g9095 [Dentipellis fragilis]|uniref:Uncharacterized protein n=1 Tax=Dentipellis fragilis TaxID=205917 RepID=A0A4Y9Y1R2_9AGAM|nr:hypothetical protein EVG20_g9095 [Dentipellis fragilis]